MNVGVRLADQMSNEQLDEFEKFVDANDDKGAFQWLESNFPNYKGTTTRALSSAPWTGPAARATTTTSSAWAEQLPAVRDTPARPKCCASLFARALLHPGPPRLLLQKAGMNEIGPTGIGRKSELAVLPDPGCASSTPLRRTDASAFNPTIRPRGCSASRWYPRSS